MDYESIWVKYVAFFEQDQGKRDKVVDNLHIEVKNGFDVLARIAEEELENDLPQELFNSIKKDLEILLPLSVFQGYVLFLIANSIDPQNADLSKSDKTNELGNTWTKEYEKDKGESLLLEINPIMSLYLEKSKQGRMNQLFAAYPDIVKSEYKDVSNIDNFMNWIAHQGYIIGLIEQKLNKNG